MPQAQLEGQILLSTKISQNTLIVLHSHVTRRKRFSQKERKRHSFKGNLTEHECTQPVESGHASAYVELEGPDGEDEFPAPPNSPICPRRRHAGSRLKSKPVSKCPHRQNSGNKELRSRCRGPGAAGGHCCCWLLAQTCTVQSRTLGSARHAEGLAPWPPPSTRPRPHRNTKPFAVRPRTPRPDAPLLTSDPGSPISPTA